MVDAGLFDSLAASLSTHSPLSQAYYKGTSTDQERRFSEKELSLKALKFPPQYDTKVLISLRPLSSLHTPAFFCLR